MIRTTDSRDMMPMVKRDNDNLLVEGLYTIDNPNSKFVLEIKNAPTRLDQAFTTLLS